MLSIKMFYHMLAIYLMYLCDYIVLMTMMKDLVLFPERRKLGFHTQEWQKTKKKKQK